MQLNRQACQTLLNEGKAAYGAGDPSDACPYNRLGDREQQFGYRYWSRGWSMARSEAESARPEPAASTGQ
ncbi:MULTISPECIES: hypothetical protein [unclassified Streptomyces]|uniref:hypothetical protein n=1 Tax=unclassified Streptomyces TaxID=2593676 RepID=UPI00225B1CD0|nr:MULTISPECIES: hypothetical protein [unclassified Streptomyces]MCX4976448.1 hypothetical protein [Streptomyces sp. NBC_00620]WRZ24318.1 hypothetical protein OHT59_40305 [Streptomyces sp. NBC_00243]